MVVKNKHEREFTEKELQLSDTGRLLSNPARIRVINLLLEHKSMTSSEIAALVPLARTTVLQHLAALKEGNWLTTSSDGSSIKYHLNNDIFSSVSGELEMFFQICANSETGKEEKSDKVKILFLCTGNSARSQMAEGFINSAAEKYNVEAFSAGTRPAEVVQPLAIEVMAEKDIDISGHHPKSAKEFVGDRSFDLVIIVCEQAEKECPYLFPYSKHKIFMPFIDPKTAEEFRKVRDQIEIRLSHLLEELTVK